MFDANAFSQHWLDIFVSALLACVGYLGVARFNALDTRIDDVVARIERAERKSEELGERIATLEGRTSPNGRIYAE